ncbi:MAG: hypothetical protein RLY31_762 [Bacteroidota bacterium]
MASVHIIGSGVVGLFSAWYLQKAGFQVTLFDQSDLTDGCSHGNAGMITPSHFVPLAAPGIVAQGFRWMFRSSSPFFIRPRIDTTLLAWLWRFYRSCNERQARRAMPVLLDFNQRSKDLYRDFQRETGLDFHLVEKGILMMYRSAKKQQEELETARMAAQLGLETQVLDRRGLQDFEHGTAVDALGAVHYPADAILHPNRLMTHLQALLRKGGAVFHTGRPVTGFETQGRRIVAVRCGQERFSADVFLLTAGSWSARLLRTLQVPLLLQDGKGYSVTLPDAAEQPAYAAILTEAKVAVTPMGPDLRFGGTLELGGMRADVNLPRVKAILEAVPQYYPRLRPALPEKKDIWYGFRPCTPDGLPYIGRLERSPNLVLATGHAMMGLSLAPATGRLVSDLLTGADHDAKAYLDAFRPGRFR